APARRRPPDQVDRSDRGRLVAARPARVGGRRGGRPHRPRRDRGPRPRPGAPVTSGLREYRDGRPVPGSNTLGWTVEKTGWRQFGAIHVANAAGARLDLEVIARRPPPRG